MLVDSSVGQHPAPPESSAFRDALRTNRAATVGEFVRGMFATKRDEAELVPLRESALRIPVEQSLSLFPSDLPREHWRAACAEFTRPLAYAVTARLAEQAHNLKAMRPQTRIEIFEGAGHALFVDQPAKFNALVADFAASAR
jgi:microsomal epoxide hydrolase